MEVVPHVCFSTTTLLLGGLHSMHIMWNSADYQLFSTLAKQKHYSHVFLQFYSPVETALFIVAAFVLIT